MKFKDVYDGYRAEFQKYRKLCEYGKAIEPIVDGLPEEDRQAITALYKNGDIDSIRRYLFNKKRRPK